MEDDAYIRIGPGVEEAFGTADSRGALVYVDLDRRDIDDLRLIPHAALRRLGTLLVRAEPGYASAAAGGPTRSPTLDEVDRITKRLNLKCKFGLVQQPVDAQPFIDGEVDEDQDELLNRARAVELDALLGWGDAVWSPTDYHFRLPSGDHTNRFVRIANAIRQPRDAQVIASWMNRHLKNDLAIVCDTGTLSAVVESLRATMRSHGLREGATAMLTHHPATPIDVRQAVRDVLGDTGRILAILSVDSSGSVAGNVIQALIEPAGAVQDWALEILIGRAPKEMPKVASWLPRPGDDQILGDRYSGGVDGGCPDCADSARSRVVPVNPVSFDGMLPGQVRQLMPDTRDARKNRPLWEACSEADGIGLEEKPDEAVAAFRPSPVKMPIHVRHGNLVQSDAYRGRVRDRLADLLASQHGAIERREMRAEEALSGNADLVLVAKHEYDLDGFDELWSEISGMLCADDAQLVPFKVDEDWSQEVKDKVGEGHDIVAFALGLVSGGSITKSLTGVQNVKDDYDYELRGLVLHARPAQRRAWEALRNAYALRLHACWLTYLPEESVLKLELEVLDSIDGDRLDGDAESTTFLNERKAFCSEGGDTSAVATFWGGHIDDHLSPHSLFGERITGINTFVAVGSALERRRQEVEPRAAPEHRVFELRALFASYFDKLILSAVLRWLSADEAWWGSDPDEANATMLTLLGRAQREADDLRVLVPELLLAVAQGKVPHLAAETVRAQAEAMLETDQNPRTQAALRVGLLAAQQHRSD